MLNFQSVSKYLQQVAIVGISSLSPIPHNILFQHMAQSFQAQACVSGEPKKNLENLRQPHWARLFDQQQLMNLNSGSLFEAA